MASPAEIALLVGLQASVAPYGSVPFTPETTCRSERRTELNPLDEDFGTKEVTTCTQAQGWSGAQGEVGEVFPGILVGLWVERERVRLSAMFSLGPAFAPASQGADWTLTPDLALGGDIALEFVVVQERFSFAVGGAGSLRSVSAHGTHGESGDTRLVADALFSGGPALSVGWVAPGLLLRASGLLTTAKTVGAGVQLIWTPARWPA